MSSHHVNLQSRQSPPHVRKSANKAARSVLSSKNTLAPRITSKPHKAYKRAKDLEDEVVDTTKEEEEDDDMDSSFLQFCAMCDKQILVPNSSILYCSESCRQRDSISNPSLTTMTAPNEYIVASPFANKIPDYVPRLRPTPRTPPDGRIPPELHDCKADLDPTEWKPSDPAISTHGKSPPKPIVVAGGGEWRPKMANRQRSEAILFLGKFHHPSSDFLVSKRRPNLAARSATTASSRTTIPSLTHTPTASTSSSEGSLAGTPYEFVSNPIIGALSMPTAHTAVVLMDGKVKDTDEESGDDISYEKKTVATSMGSAAGSLVKLLGTAAMGAM